MTVKRQKKEKYSISLNLCEIIPAKEVDKKYFHQQNLIPHKREINKDNTKTGDYCFCVLRFSKLFPNVEVSLKITLKNNNS